MASISAARITADTQAHTVMQQQPITADQTLDEEAVDVSRISINRAGADVVVTLWAGEKPIKYKIGFDKFLIGLGAAVAFINMHLTQLFDVVGGP
jgi:hypothetical protein